eukprot:680831-Pyramimonas_sp.AAC.1
MSESNFVHCGLRRRQLEDMNIEVGQTEYINNLNCIDEKELQGRGDDEDPPEKHVKHYPSLLGAIAWCIMTRVDTCIYVAALQRHGKAPKVGHIRKMNVLLKYMKESPLVLTAQRLTPPAKLMAVGDVAFRREPLDQGLAMRGAVYLLIETKQEHGGRCNVLEYYSRKQAHVVRSTWGA